jgi:AsmA protein
VGRLIRLFGIVAGALVVLVVAVGVLVGFLFDPNDYKEEITAAVRNATGRTLEINGDLELGIFPSVRIAIGPSSLSNAAGFDAEFFAQIDAASLQVAVLPLLSGRIDVGQARLEGLRLNLERNAGGETNWQDLGGAESDAPAGGAASGSESASASELDLGIGAVVISDAEVSWRDASTGTDWLLTDFEMDAEGFGLATAFPLELGFRFAGPELSVAVESDTQATLDIAANTYRLEDLNVSIDGSGPAWPGGEGSASLGFRSFTANLDEQSVALDELVLEILGLEIMGTLRGERLFDNLSLTGGINIAEFNPNDLLTVFGTEIETADDSVFRRASAQAEFVYDSSQMAMRNTVIALDDSTLTGSVGFQGDALKFDLNVDRINIDRYLPPASEESSNADEGSVDEVDLPVEPLRNFVADGDLRFGETQFMGLTLTDANFSLAAANGRMRLAPTGSLYGGSINGEIVIAVQDDAARISLVQELDNVDLHDLAVDFLDSEDLSGTGDVSLNLTAVGSNVGAMRRDLDGMVSFALSDGAWEGIDAWYEIRRARAVTLGNASPERDGPVRTSFSRVSVSGAVEDGVLTTNDLNATLPFMALNGTGTVDLLNDALNISATAGFVDGPILQSDPDMAGLAGDELPLTVTGSLGAPSIRPDFGALVRAQVQSAIQERVEEEREEIREEVQDRARERLRGLFDR